MAFAWAADGTRLHYQVLGRPSADPLLMIQGLGADMSGWTLQRIAFSPRYRTIALDNRGAGRSDKPFGRYLLEEMAVDVDARSTFLGRPLPLIAESDLNDPRLISPRPAGGYGLDAQWSDDFHHAVYVNLTGDTSGYYADFDSLDALGKVFEAGFFHDGTKSTFRGRSHGHPIDTHRTQTWRLVVCSDNHDQIGNRAAGERLSAKLNRQQLSIAAMLTLLSPFTPMIFMGEEWGAGTPWRFFSSHPEPELGVHTRGTVTWRGCRGWPLPPLVVPRPRDLSDPAGHRDVIPVKPAELLDQPEPHVGSTFSRAK